MTTIVAVELGGTGANNTADARAALGVISSTVSNAAYSQANSAYGQANLAYTQANNAYTQANNAYTQANNSYGQANSAYAQANLGYTQANTATTNAGNAHNQANNAYGQANLAYTQANSAYTQANNSYGQANLAYDAANTKFSLTGGSITGNVTINGNLTVQGNATTINVSNLSVNDSIILLATNQVGDSNDIGFVGHFDRGATATHAGIIRKASQNQFYLFDNYEVEPTNNVIDVTGNNFRVGNLRLGIINADSFVTTSGLNVTNQANNAYAQANLAYTAANNRVLKAGDTMTGRLGISNTTDNVVTSGIILTGNRNYLAGDNGGIQIIATGSGGTIGTHDFGAIKFSARGFTGAGDGGGGIVSLHVGGSSSNATSNGMFIQADGTIAQGTQNVKFYTGSSATERMRIDSSGNVGIGTASPVTRLHVLDALSGGQFIVANSETNAAEKYGTFATQHYTNAEEPALGFAIQSNSTDNNILIGGALGEFNAATTVRFYTAANNTITTGTERMRIDSSGNVGVGTSAPASRLDVYTATASGGNSPLFFSANNSVSAKTNYVQLGFTVEQGLAGSETGGYSVKALRNNSLIDLCTYDGAATVQAWKFFTEGSERLRITSNGFIGVGTTTPNAALHITTTNNVGPILRMETTGNSVNTAFWMEDQDANVAARAMATMDLSAGLGLFNLYAGAYTVASTNYYGSTRGATRIGMHDNTFNFFTANASGAGQSTGTAVTWYQTLAMSNSSFIVYTNNGTERLRVSETGNVGIGAITTPSTILALPTTTSRLSWGTPAGAYALGSSGGGGLLFGVNGDSEYFAIETHLSGIGHAERFRITEAGNVGIGTASPGSFNAAGLPLVVGSGGGNQGLTIFSSTTGYGGIHFADGTAGDASYRGIVYYQHSNDSMQFWTSATERMRIDSSGNVGIGTSAPGTRLEAYVAGGGPIIRAASDATGGGAGNGFHIGLDGSAGAYLSQNENAPLYFYTNATEKMILTAAGNLGIAVSSPAHRLQLGTTSSVSTATPETISLGGTYSSSAGGNAKLRVWTDGTNVMGLGVSSNQLDFICSGGYSHVFYTNGSERARIPSGGGFSVGTTSSPGAGAIYATGEITAFFSDDRLKNRLRNIDNALSKVLTLNGFYYEPNETAMNLGYEKKKQVGVSAQEVQEVLPEVVVAAPIDAEYMTVHYHKLVPLLIEAIKELNTKIEDMQKIIESKN